MRAAAAAHIPVRAIILTQLTERDSDIAEATNYDALVGLLPDHEIFRFPWVDRTDSLDALAAAAEGSGLDVLFAERHSRSIKDVVPTLTV